MRAAVAAVVLVTVGALATGADAADGEGQPHRRRRRDSSDLQQQMQARGLPFEGLSPVQMQEALAADSAAATGDSGADKDSNNCPAGSVFDQAERHEYCVVGAGPGGLQMAAFLHSAQRDYVVFERAPEAASFYKRYPRHRKLISINKRNTGRNNAEFNWRHDWNSLLSPESGPAADAPRFAEFSRDYFPDADTWVDYAANYSQGLNINYRTDVVKVSRAAKSRGGDFVLRTNSPEQDGKHIRCQTLIIATSLPKAYAPPIEGLLENSIGYDEDEFSVNKEDYENKTVLILGKKQSAMETAKHIYGHTAELHIVSPSRARIAWESHYVGDIRAVNAEVLDAYQLKSLDSIIDADLGGTSGDRASTKQSEAYFSKRADGKIIIKWKSPEQQADPSLAAYADTTKDDRRRQPECVLLFHAALCHASASPLLSPYMCRSPLFCQVCANDEGER
jgi:thioredoxin reductase